MWWKNWFKTLPKSVYTIEEFKNVLCSSRSGKLYRELQNESIYDPRYYHLLRVLEKNNYIKIIDGIDGTKVKILVDRTYITFGIEFEGNVRDYKNIIEYQIPARYACAEGWDYQTDPTAYFELRSPVWDDINQAAEDVKKEFSFWIERNSGRVPFFKPTRHYYSIGGHIHIGVGEGVEITGSEAEAFMRKLVRFMPFLYFINSNGVVRKYISARMVERPYSPLKADKTILEDREEWCLSGHGTIEFRRFDGNVPPVQLAVAFLMKNILLYATEEDYDINLFQAIVKDCLRYPSEYSVLLKAREVFREIGDVSIENLPEGVKEVLILSFCFLKNPALFQKTFTYDFCKRTVEKLEFLGSAIEEYSCGDRRKIFTKVKELLNQVKTINDLLNILILDRETEFLIKAQDIKINYQRLSRNQEKLVNKWIKQKDKKPPFVPSKMWKNISVVSPIVWLRLKSLNLPQLMQLQEMTGKDLHTMQSEVGRYYVKCKENTVIGYFVVNVPERKLTEVRNVTKDEVRELLRKVGIYVVEVM